MAGSICWYRERYRERMFPTLWKNQSLDSRSLASPNNQCKENHKHNPKLLRPHLTLVRMAIITSTKDKILVKTWGKRCLQLLMSEYQLTQPLWESVWGRLQTSKIELPYGTIFHIPLVDIFPKDSAPPQRFLHTNVYYDACKEMNPA